jgi:hypothetical protein
MNTINSLSARQLRRAAEIKEEIYSLEGELNRIADSYDANHIHLIPERRRRLRTAIKAGARSLVLPAQRLKRQFGTAARSKFAAAARSRLDRIRNIEIT